MPGYRQLSFRADNIAGGIDVARAWLDAEKLRGLEHLVFLIHGYNNTRTEAEAAYSAFCANQQALAPEGRDWTADATLVQVFWPGDATSKALYYPWAVSRGQEVASIFAQMADDWSQYCRARLQLDFVAHSLGNRVLLRTLALIAGNDRVLVRRVVHMAAAVPTWKLGDDPQDQDQLARALLKETASESRATSLYSRADMVLAWAFPWGETISAEHDGLFPTALGHDYWTDAIALENFRQWAANGAGHSDYWGHMRSTPDNLRDWVMSTVKRELDLGAAGARSIRGNPGLAPGAPAARVDASRHLASRQPGQSID